MTAVPLPRLDWGDAERSILLIHGLSSSAATMTVLAEALVADGWRVTAVDLRGHGLAPRALSYRLVDFVDDLVEVTHDGGWDVVVGHSLGGASALLTANAVPGWTDRLILLDPAIVIDEATAIETRDGTLDGYRRALAGEIVAADSGWDERSIALKQQATLQIDPEGIAQIMANLPWDLRAELSAVAVPTLILGADPQLGPLFTAAQAEQTASPHTTFATIPGAGHSVHRDQPERTLAAMREWLAAGS